MLTLHANMLVCLNAYLFHAKMLTRERACLPGRGTHYALRVYQGGGEEGHFGAELQIDR